MERLVAEFLVRSVLIAGATAGVLKLLRVSNARVKHAAWVGVAIVMLFLPAWTAFGPHETIRVLRPVQASARVHATTAEVDPQIAVAPSAVARTPPQQKQNARVVWLAIYGIGLIVLLLRLAIGSVRARLLSARAVMSDGRLTSASCTSPITVGFFRPVVILPEGWDGWEQERLDAVLAHEAEHALHRDPLAQWIALLNRAVFFFHPLAWWLERRISSLAEEACDEAVMAKGHDRAAYSESLLAFARAAHASGARVRAFGMAMPGQFLPRRIRKIMDGIPVNRVSRARKGLVLVACTAIAVALSGSAIGYVRVHADEEQTPAPPAAPSAPRPPAPAPPPVAPAPPKPPKPPAAPRPDASADAGNRTELQTRIAELREQIVRAQAQMTLAQKELQKLNLDRAIRAATSAETQKQIAEAKRLLEGDLIRRQIEEAQRAIDSGEIQKQTEQYLRDMQSGLLSAPRSSNVITSMVKPRYTDDARAAEITGDVLVSFTVGPNGEPADVRVSHGIGHGLDESAVEAVKQWRFVSVDHAGELQVRFHFAAGGQVTSEVLSEQ